MVATYFVCTFPWVRKRLGKFALEQKVRGVRYVMVKLVL